MDAAGVAVYVSQLLQEFVAAVGAAAAAAVERDASEATEDEQMAEAQTGGWRGVGSSMKHLWLLHIHHDDCPWVP